MAFFRKAILVNASTLASVAIQMVQTIIVTRALGPGGIGQYSLVASTLMLCAQLCTLGFPTSLLYHCQHDAAGRNTYTMNGIWATAVLGGLGTIILALVTRLHGHYFGPLSWLACGIGGLYVLLTPLSGITRNALMCDMKARRLSIMAVGSMVAPLPLVCGLAAFGRLNVTTALFSFVATPLVRLTLGAWWMREDLDWRIRPTVDVVRRLGLMGVRLSSVDVLILFNSAFSLMILKALDANFDHLGQFSRGQQLAMAVVTASQAVLPLLFSRWAALPEAELTRHVELVLRFLATFSVVIIAVLMICARTLVVTLYGIAFAPAVVPMMILLPGTLFFLLAKVATQLLGSRGLPELSIAMLIVGAAVNALLSWLLIPGLGIHGAAVASTLGNLALLVCLLVTLRSRFSVHLGRCLWLTGLDWRGILKQLHWSRSRVRQPQGGLPQVQ